MTPNQAPDLASPLSRRFAVPAADATVTRTVAALEGNGAIVLRAANAAEAKRLVLDLIPDGTQVHHASSMSLELSGIVEEIECSGRYESIRQRLWNMDRETQADEIRQLSSSPEVMLGSMNAVTESGSLVAASATGIQLGPYAYGAGKVILVVGVQKIVSDLGEALERVDEYVLPLEDERAQAAYGAHSSVNNLLIIHRTWIPGRLTVVLVDEALGF